MQARRSFNGFPRGRRTGEESSVDGLHLANLSSKRSLGETFKHLLPLAPAGANLIAFVERMDNGKAAPQLEEEHKARYRFAMRFCRSGRILDVACGAGYGSGIIADASPVEVVGCDASPEAIVQAKENHAHPSVAFIVADATCLPFISTHFDVYTSFETIEHVHNPDLLLNEAARVCRQGALLILSTPNRLVTNPGTSLGAKPPNPFHIMEFTLREIESMLEQNGFAVEALYGQLQRNALKVRLWDSLSRSSLLSKWALRILEMSRVMRVSPSSLGSPPPSPGRVVEPLGWMKEPLYYVIIARKL